MGFIRPCVQVSCEARSVVALRAARRKSAGGGNRPRVRGRTGRASTSLGCPLVSPDGRSAAALPPGQPSFGLAPPTIGFSSAPARLLTPLPEPRAEFGATRHLTVS